jgi:hypothetical protein
MYARTAYFTSKRGFQCLAQKYCGPSLGREICPNSLISVYNLRRKCRNTLQYTETSSFFRPPAWARRPCYEGRDRASSGPFSDFRILRRDYRPREIATVRAVCDRLEFASQLRSLSVGWLFFAGVPRNRAEDGPTLSGCETVT